MINDIFLIDDDGLVNFLNKEIILEYYPQRKITCFENALTALEELKERSKSEATSLPQLILLDINMPVMDGWEFLDEFVQLPKSLLSACKIIVHTSSIDPRDVEKAKSYNAVTDYLTKPLTMQQLAAIFK